MLQHLCPNLKIHSIVRHQYLQQSSTHQVNPSHFLPQAQPPRFGQPNCIRVNQTFSEPTGSQRIKEKNQNLNIKHQEQPPEIKQVIKCKIRQH